MADTNDSWTTAIAAHSTALRAAGLAPGTIRLYRHYLRRLARVAPSPWAVTIEHLHQVLAQPTWKPETRKSARAAFRSFYRWAHATGRLDVDPTGALDPIRVPPGVARPTPEQVLARALMTARTRERLMLLLAAYAGLRCAEIARVHRADLVDDVLMVHGKGGKVRPVPIVHDELLGRLRRLEGYAFPNREGAPMTPGHVSRLLSAALPDLWTGHTLRHRMASSAYAGTRDLLAVGALLGHSRPETTQRYVRMPDDALRAAVMAACAA